MESKNMDDLAREVRREYFREWRKRNPEKVRESNRRYWQKKAAQKNSGNTSAEGGGTNE